MSCRFTLHKPSADAETEEAAGPRGPPHGRRGRAGVNGVLEVLDGGHPTDAFMAEVEAAQQDESDIPVIGDLAMTYGRWAARLANEYKLKFGIPKRTEANRLVAREWLHKHLRSRNTRYQHMRSVIPLALELCFLKDSLDLEVEALMLDPSVVRRAQQSVQPYWQRKTWAAWLADNFLPGSASRALARAFPGTFRAVPGFSA